MAARRHPVTVRPAADLVAEGSDGPQLVELFVHRVEGECEFIEGADAASTAAALLARLEAEGVL